MAGIHIILYQKSALLGDRIKSILALENDVLYVISEKSELWDVLFRTQGNSRVVIADVDGEADNDLFFLRRIIKSSPTPG